MFYHSFFNFLKHFLVLICLVVSFGQTNPLLAQQDSLSQKKLQLTGDFRFRLEQDWDSRKSDGTFRNDRSRMRIRTRFGATYQHNSWASFGFRLRTGNLEDQQGPHLTLGRGNGEFSNFQLGLEKAYFKIKHKNITAWVGKNDLSFQKQNELFWNDNVFPEGAFFSVKWPISSKLVDELSINAAHFIVQASNETFDKDSYFQAIQLVTKHWNGRLKIFPSFYYFNRLADIPDGKGTIFIPYSILHLGGNFKILKKPNLEIGVDYYHNSDAESVTFTDQMVWRNQNAGIVFSLKAGELKKQGDWLLHLYYAHLEKFAVVDYFAQNDWARWDFSGQGATGARLTNFQGMELRIGYAVGKKFNLILRAYRVEQLVATGAFLETGSRVRLDLDIGF